MTLPMSGRRAQAARNDEAILAAARAVFVADPGAPIAAVADRAGVGISALYRRYASKEDLLRKLCADGLRRYIADAEAALADQSDPWTAFAGFMRRVVDADTHSLTLNLAGTFTPTEDLYRDATRADVLNRKILARAKAAGVVRAEVEITDLALLFEQLAATQVGDERRTVQLRHRYLALILDGLHQTNVARLPGPPPKPAEIEGRWTPVT
ncbi:MAG TPA: TetR/AcrR family transcriptional regulator [Micromonosporaceae bacterium]|nr:TetR/AcrR family transcriptional regulator [Micromonosporaceae bacterium]